MFSKVSGDCAVFSFYPEGVNTNYKKKSNPSFSIEGGTKKGGKEKSLDTEQIYGHGFQWGSMPGVTVLAGCRQ
jgi:hypothetical protein